jgi:hypothetical protein
MICSSPWIGMSTLNTIRSTYNGNRIKNMNVVREKTKRWNAKANTFATEHIAIDSLISFRQKGDAMNPDEIQDDLFRALSGLKTARDKIKDEPVDQSSLVRHYSIMITDLEKIIAYYDYFKADTYLNAVNADKAP